MCGNLTTETRDHLFFHCTFASWCWSHLLPDWVIPDADIHLVLQSFKNASRQPFFTEVFILANWGSQLTRNDHIFRGIKENLYRCKRKFKEELDWVILRAKNKGLLISRTGFIIIADHM
jgi:hypothetical protein